MMSKQMDKLLKLEELSQFLLSIILFYHFDYVWWWFPACILMPDLSMVGYLINTKMGAWLYNFFHHKLVGIILLFLGIWLDTTAITLAGIILFGHAAMDRIFGYGLKFNDSFTHTHLGMIGKKS